MKSILTIGELLWDLLPDERKLGGAPANFAYRLQELGNDVILVSRVGKDSLGKEAKKILKRAELDTSFIQKDKVHPTGTVNVFFDEHKNPDYEINTGVAYDFMEVKTELLTKTSHVDCFAFGTLVQRSEKSRETIRTLARAADSAVKFCDLNLRKGCFTKESIAASLKMADIAKLNHNELHLIGGMFGIDSDNDVNAGLELTNRFGVKVCLVTYEADGALAFFDKDKVIYSPGYQVQMEDPVGSGDAFSAAFVHKYLLDRPVAEALDAANLHGAMVAMQKGAMEPIDLSNYHSIRAEGFARVEKEEFSHLIPDHDTDDLLAKIIKDGK